MHRVKLLNGEFDPFTLRQTVDAVFSMLRGGQRGWLCTVNVAILMMMRSDAWLQTFVQRAALVVADGQPLIWYSARVKQPLPERVTGVDLIDALCGRAAQERKCVYVLGATPDVIQKVADKLRDRYAGLRIEFGDGYFKHQDAAARADRIRSSGTDILIVGMGVPRQEKFIEEQWDRLGVGLAIGVGGSFDVLAGLRSRAPVWIQQIGMEWLFRLVQEPRRLLRRYLVTNSQFIWLVCRALVQNKRV